MRKLVRRIISMVVAVSMTFSLAMGVNFVGMQDTVKAAESMPADSTQITTDIVPDIQLCYALRQIIGGDKYKDITIKDLRTYTGTIDLSVYADYDKIESLEGLGYARKASAIDASKLTKVKQIKNNEFQGCEFSTFGMPSNIIEIGKEAFFNCVNLTYVKLPETLRTIQSEAFRNCKVLDGIVFPEQIAKIGNNAFAVCESLSSIVIPDNINAAIGNAGDDSVVGLGGGVFDNCTGLKSVKLGAGMTAIPAGFLAHTDSLRYINIPKGIINIMDGAFAGSGIFSIDLSANPSITTIATSVFEGCTDLNSVKLPNTIESIEEGAFNSCVSLTDFSFVSNLPNLKNIGNSAFQNCSFQTVTIPATVEKIGAHSFALSGNLNKVVIKDFDVVNGNVVKRIDDGAFAGSHYLESVTLPTKNEYNPQVTIEIGKYAFDKCRHLEKINFPANVTKIEAYAFNECGYSITDWADDYDEFPGVNKAESWYILPENIHDTKQPGDEELIIFTVADSRWHQPNVAYINPKDKSKIKSEIGNNAATIYVQLDFNDPKFKNGSELHYQYMIGLQNADMSKCSQLTLGDHAFYKCVNLKTVSLPNELKAIPDYAFAECGTSILMGNGNSVSSINIEDYPKNIYSDWYYGLETVKMGNKIESIGNYAFNKDYNLVIDAELPSNLKTIGKRAFERCESLKSVTFPNKLEVIDQYAFSETSRIAKDVMSEQKLVDIDVSYANNLQFIGSYAFNKSGIKNFIMDKNAPLTKIDTKTFYGCQYLDTVVLGKRVSDIGNGALGACLRLKSVNVYDCCTFEYTSIKGGILRNSRFSSDMQYGHCGYPQNDDFYLTTYEFNLAITPLNDYMTVRLNEAVNLPLYTIDFDSNGYYSQVKIGDNTYIYNPNTAMLEGEQNPAKTNMFPAMVKDTNVVLANDYIKQYSTNVFAVALEGLTEGKNIAVNVQEYLSLEVATGVVATYSPTVTYTVDVTGIPCVDIVTDEKRYISVSSTKGLTIAPQFVSDTGAEITDEVEWEILTGADYITMTVAADGKSVSVKPTGNGCGSASIQIKAGQVVKTIYVNTVAPAYSVSIGPSSKIDMSYGMQTEITATAKYYDEYSDMADEYPDNIAFTSSNEKVVKVVKTVDAEGKTICTLLAVGAGSVTITASATAGNGSAKMTVYVSSDNLQLTLTDGNGETVATGDTREIRTNSGATYTYALSETLGNGAAIVESSNEAVAKATVTATTKKVKFNVYKTGKTEITIYPAVGTKKNGVTFTLYVNSDVSVIRLSNKSIPSGNSDSIFTYMTNKFNQKITEANAATFASITDNTIEFVSSNPEYVTVDKYGKVTVKKYSEDVKSVTVTCTAYNKAGEAVKSTSTTVTLQKPVVKSVNVTGNTSMRVGDTVNYKLTVTPAEGEYTRIAVSIASGSNKTVSYKISRDYKTISVKGLAAGTVTLKIEVKKYNTVYASKLLKITVNKLVVKAPAKVKWAKCKGATKKVSLKWKKVSKAAGYQIQISTKKNGKYKTKKTITSGKTIKCTISKLKKKKVYYFRMRAYVKDSAGKKKYGKWSAKKKLKTK